MGERKPEFKRQEPKPQVPLFHEKAQLSATGVIEHLRRFASEQRLVGGPKVARDKMKIEMQGFVVDAMQLPEQAKTELKRLMAIRMAIVDQKKIAKDVGRVNVEPAIRVFEELKRNLETHANVIVAAGVPSQNIIEIKKQSKQNWL